MESMMTVHQVAELLGVHENWVYDQAASGGLPSYKIGGTAERSPRLPLGAVSNMRSVSPSSSSRRA